MSSTCTRFTGSVRASGEVSSQEVTEFDNSFDLKVIAMKRERKLVRAQLENQTVKNLIEEVSSKCMRQEKQKVRIHV